MVFSFLGEGREPGAGFPRPAGCALAVQSVGTGCLCLRHGRSGGVRRLCRRQRPPLLAVVGVGSDLPRPQCLSRLAASPVFIPLGGKPRFYLAWRQTQYLCRLAASPGFIPLGGNPSVCPAWRRTQVLSRLAVIPVFVPLGGLSVIFFTRVGNGSPTRCLFCVAVIAALCL